MVARYHQTDFNLINIGKSALPAFEEQLVGVDLCPAHTQNSSFAKTYRRFERVSLKRIRRYAKADQKQLQGRTMAHLMDNLSLWLDNPTESVQTQLTSLQQYRGYGGWRGLIYRVALTGGWNCKLLPPFVIAEAPALNAAVLYPKEEQLLELIRQERAAQRRVIIFVPRDRFSKLLSKRLASLIAEQANAKAGILLTAATTKPGLRQQWINSHQEIDVMLCSPLLLRNGLNLESFSTRIFYGSVQNVAVLLQASSSGWIKSKQPCRVYHLFYKDTVQAAALKAALQKRDATLTSRNSSSSSL